jgi:hypothetical protein
LALGVLGGGAGAAGEVSTGAETVEEVEAAAQAADSADAGGGARYIFRTGSQTENALTDPSGVSFRDSVSSSSDGSQTFQPGAKVFAVDTELLPDGSVAYDGKPDGHVTVNATAADIQSAVVQSFPNNPLAGLRQLEDGSWRLPNK